ncbi:hypothetical protein D9O36_07570 [Zobellia amurskyensis]|uniref:LPXTG-motif cell wall-anchored protein n=1 Tax=Zobellia amurskyensis TaxID=248905 RepID=A0A7X2ZSQ6_9FLAO|nr:hypothetical protein [Zobellia amurskyensis]MUH35693.1 hypothetical protein [Zobellia amurskyensis]
MEIIKKIAIGFVLCFCSLFAHAHSSQIATMTLAEDQQNNWTLHISSSFDGFRYQLAQNYPDIKTDELSADEFQKLVINYVKDNILLNANSGFIGELREGAIKIGHQTDLKFRVAGLPNDIKTLRVQLKGFAETSKHNTVFKIVDHADTSKNFVIKKDNQFTIQIEKSNGQFQVKGQEANLFWPFTALTILVIVSIFAISRIFKKEETVLRAV